MKHFLIVLLLVVVAFGATIPKNFNKAKDMSTRLYYTYHMISFYTGSEMVPIVRIYKKKFPLKSSLELQLGLKNSPYEGTKYVSRGKKIEWEHVVPASWLVKAVPEANDAWENGHPLCVTSSGRAYKGRKCAEKVSEEFNLMEADMNNLVPVIGALNALRSDKPYGIIDGEIREFGETLDIEINKSTIEVMPSRRGDVARIMIKMQKKYNLIYPDHNNTMIMLNQWDKDDPISDWEKQKEKILKDTYGIDY